MSEVLPQYANAPWNKGEKSGVRYLGVSLDGRNMSEKAATTPEPKKMPMAPRTLPQAPVQAALKDPPPIVQDIEQQLLAAALAWMASAEQEYKAARRQYVAAYNSWTAAHSMVLGLQYQRHGEQQSKRQKTRG